MNAAVWFKRNCGITSVTKTLKVSLSQAPIFEVRESGFEVTCYGNVYNLHELAAFKFKDAKADQLAGLLNRLSGYFLLEYVDRDRGLHIVANDIFGNFRTYIVEDEDAGKLYLFDDAQAAADRAKESGRPLVECANERYYFNRHRYTTGGATLFKQIRKLMPATMLICGSGNLVEKIYFTTKIARQTDDDLYIQKNRELVADNLARSIRPECKNILFFTGGIDSTYLAMLLKEQGVDFLPVFIKYRPQDNDNFIDETKIRAASAWLSQPVRTIEVSIRDHYHLIETAVRRHPFDKTLAIPFYEALRQLRDEFGCCNIINGQSSDSIYCWGSSSKTLGGVIQRLLTSMHFAGRPAYIRWAIATVAGLIYRHRGKIGSDEHVPVNLLDYWAGLLDPAGYLPVVHARKTHSDYCSYLDAIAERVVAELNGDLEATIMYMKMMYLQGTSNSFVIESTREYGHNLVMPFVDARLVFLKMSMQNESRNLRHPRYVLEETLRRRYNIDLDVIERGRRGRADAAAHDEYQKVLAEVFEQWDCLSRKLF